MRQFDAALEHLKQVARGTVSNTQDRLAIVNQTLKGRSFKRPRAAGGF